MAITKLLKSKKTITFLFSMIFTFSFLFFFNNTANAGEIVNIVSGLDKSHEVTFDTYKVISGEAKKDTVVIIKHYISDNGTDKLNKVSIKNIGLSEMFAEMLKLEDGINTVKISAKLGEKHEALEYKLNKKDNKIKEKLDAVGNIFDIK